MPSNPSLSTLALRDLLSPTTPFRRHKLACLSNTLSTLNRFPHLLPLLLSICSLTSTDPVQILIGSRRNPSRAIRSAFTLLAYNTSPHYHTFQDLHWAIGLSSHTSLLPLLRRPPPLALTLSRLLSPHRPPEPPLEKIPP